MTEFSGAKSADCHRIESLPRETEETPYRDPNQSLRKPRSKSRKSPSLTRSKINHSFEANLSTSDAEQTDTSAIVSLKSKLKARKGKRRQRIARGRICASADLLLDATLTSTQKSLLPAAKRITRPGAAVPNPDLFPMMYSYLSATLSQTVLQSNGFPSIPSTHNYKFYVGPGNNDQLIALLMKRRWYWTRVDTWTQADFIWTQNRVMEIVQKLPGAPHAVKLMVKEEEGGEVISSCN